MRVARTAACVLGGLLLVAACSSGATVAPTSALASARSSGSGAAVAVTIENFSFQPAALSVAVGTTVTWTNKDSVGHTVTADDGSFASRTLANGATFSHTFTSASTFSYHCAIHPYMKATITVH